MESLIEQITSSLDSDDQQSKDAISIILNFLKTSGPADSS